MPCKFDLSLKKNGFFPVDPKAISGEQMAPSNICAQDQTQDHTADSLQPKMAGNLCSQPDSVDDGVLPRSHGDTSLTHHKHTSMQQ